VRQPAVRGAQPLDCAVNFFPLSFQVAGLVDNLLRLKSDAIEYAVYYNELIDTSAARQAVYVGRGMH
jgi:hypothetical protein